MKNTLLILLGFILGAIATYYYCCNQEEGLEGIVIPKGLITSKEAKTLDHAFDSRHQLISDSIVKRPDNRSSWYSINDMQAYLTYAKKQADSLNYKLDGIRVYLGAYPTTKEVGYTTLFFVPTGTQNTSQGNMFNFQTRPSHDIPGGSGLNDGEPGDPPNINYPQ